MDETYCFIINFPDCKDPNQLDEFLQNAERVARLHDDFEAGMPGRYFSGDELRQHVQRIKDNLISNDGVVGIPTWSPLGIAVSIFIGSGVFQWNGNHYQVAKAPDITRENVVAFLGRLKESESWPNLPIPESFLPRIPDKGLRGEIRKLKRRRLPEPLRQLTLMGKNRTRFFMQGE